MAGFKQGYAITASKAANPEFIEIIIAVEGTTEKRIIHRKVAAALIAALAELLA